MPDSMTVVALQQMKRDGRKIAGIVAWDTPMAKIADRAGVDLVSVGDSVGVNLWGHDDPLQVTMDEMLTVCKAVRRGTTRALVSCDLPYGPAQESPDDALGAAMRVCTENLIRIDRVTESPNVNGDDRALLPRPDPVRLAVQVEEPT
jgi:3-methyl-2-oxobutanoate hydroxymethyltransferase